MGDKMIQHDETANRNAAPQDRQVKPKRRSWGLPRADGPPDITEKELITVRKILGFGSVPEAFNLLDRPITSETNETLVGFFKGKTDTEAEYTVAELAAVTEKVLGDLERDNPRHGEVIRRRMRGETLEEIGADFGITRERIRQIEAKAQRMLRDDIRMRALAENLGMTVRIDEAVEYLQLFGFSSIFIERWRKRGFPSFAKLRTVAILTAEIAYPQCLRPQEECEGGKDRLDKEKFARLTANINLRIVNELCVTNDLVKLMTTAGEYLAKCLQSETEQTDTTIVENIEKKL